MRREYLVLRVLTSEKRVLRVLTREASIKSID